MGLWWRRRLLSPTIQGFPNAPSELTRHSIETSVGEGHIPAEGQAEATNSMGVKMRNRMRLGRPSHATVVAYLALFVALGGSAYAVGNLGKNTVGSKQLRRTR
jgi:hypothetical protein